MWKIMKKLLELQTTELSSMIANEIKIIYIIDGNPGSASDKRSFFWLIKKLASIPTFTTFENSTNKKVLRTPTAITNIDYNTEYA